MRAATPTPPNPVNYNTKSMSRSSRLHEMVLFFQPCKLRHKINFLDHPSQTGPGLGLGCDPKTVFGHNLHHMPPFPNPRPGFCMVFRCASFWFLVPGTHFWTPEPKFGPGISKFGPGWPGEVWEAKMGVGKTWFCEGMVLKMGIMGFPATQMDCMVPRRPLGKPVSPQTPLKNDSPRLSPVFGKFGDGPPGPPCGSPSFPLWIA